MHELVLMLNLRAVGFMKSVFTLRWQALLRNISSFLIFGGFAAGVFFLTRFLTSYLLHEAHIGQFLFHRLLSMLLYVFFITVNLGNMIVSFATLYRSQEISFLMSMPISHAKIFLVKFVDNFFYSSSTLSMVGFAVLLGYGSVFGLPWYGYLFIAFGIILPFMLIAGILAVLTLMALIRVTMHIGVRWLIAILVSGYLGAIYVYFKITNPVQMVHEVMKHYPDVNDYFGYLDPPFVQYLPNHWVTEFLYWSVNGDYGRALPYFTLLSLTMIGLIVFAGLMARKYYYRSWVAASDAAAMSGPRKSFRFRLMEFGGGKLISPQLDVLIKRDFWLFFREPSQWLHLMLMLLLLMIFVVSVGTLEMKLTQPFLQAVSFLVVFLFNGFLIASISLRFIFPAVSLEGETFWAVRTSPFSLTRLYWYKFGWAFVVLFIIGESLSIASIALMNHGADLIKLAAFSTLFMSIALISLNLGSGTYFAVFKEKNPIRVASSQGASLTFLGSMIYLTIVITILMLPLLTYFESLAGHGTLSSGWITAPLLMIGAFSLLIAGACTGLGLRTIKKDFR